MLKNYGVRGESVRVVLEYEMANCQRCVLTESSLFILGSTVVTNLPLQMALYFNVVFFPFWLITIIFMLYHKVGEKLNVISCRRTVSY